MTRDQREIRRKFRILEHAEKIGDVSKTCRYFGIGRANFYRWRKAYQERGEAGLINAKPIPKWHANRTAPDCHTYRDEKHPLCIFAADNQVGAPKPLSLIDLRDRALLGGVIVNLTANLQRVDMILKEHLKQHGVDLGLETGGAGNGG